MDKPQCPNRVSAAAVTPPQPASRPKAYSRVKLSLGIGSSVLAFALMVLLLGSGLSRTLADWARATTGHAYSALLLFALTVGILQLLVTLPFGFASGYLVEHRFGLSRQTFGRWAWERIKGFLVSAPLAALVIIGLYVSLEISGSLWWIPVGIMLTIMSILLTGLAPILLFPLFYRFTPVEDGPLKERLLELCAAAGISVRGVYRFNLSKNTRKANAALAGIGRSRRIIFGDTLLAELTGEEIETVFAHELGHHYHRHIAVGITAGIVSTFAGLFLTALLFDWSSALFGFAGRTDIAALPLLGIWLALFGLVTSPLTNMLSRHHERQADAYAVAATRKPAAFASALRKLAAQNLADPEPHPLIEFLFYSHPSIGRRIATVEGMIR